MSDNLVNNTIEIYFKYEFATYNEAKNKSTDILNWHIYINSNRSSININSDIINDISAPIRLRLNPKERKIFYIETNIYYLRSSIQESFILSDIVVNDNIYIESNNKKINIYNTANL